MKKCVACGYERKETDDAPDWQCPSCEVAYIKAEKSLNNKKKESTDDIIKNKDSHKEHSKKDYKNQSDNDIDKKSDHSKEDADFADNLVKNLKKPINGASILLAIVLIILALPFFAGDGFNPISFSGFVLLMMMFGAIGMYFLPWLVALGREHNATIHIFFVNLLIGWTVLGWIICLVWSLTSNTKQNQRVIVIRK